MKPQIPAQWRDPHHWPWIFWIWLAMIAASRAKPVWNWFRRKRASSWPVTIGKVESASVDERKGFLSSLSSRGDHDDHFAKLNYSYSVAGTSGAGVYKRRFFSEADAWEFIRDLKGKPVTVHYNPNKTSSSALLEQSVETLTQTRAPLAPGGIVLSNSANEISPFLSQFLWVFIAVAVVGLIASVCVHIEAVMGRLVLPEAFFFLLHVGVFVVWFPAIFIARKRTRGVSRSDFWKVVLKGSPEWVRYAVYGLFAYAFLNFLYFMMVQFPSGNGPGHPSTVEWQGFSSYWIVFYSVALATLYTEAKSNENAARCANGHRMSANANFCTRCGASAVRN
jgi:hypothetical protein